MTKKCIIEIITTHKSKKNCAINWTKVDIKSSIFRSYFFEELRASTIPTGFTPATRESQNQRAKHCINGDYWIPGANNITCNMR